MQPFPPWPPADIAARRLTLEDLAPLALVNPMVHAALTHIRARRDPDTTVTTLIALVGSLATQNERLRRIAMMAVESSPLTVDRLDPDLKPKVDL